MTRDAKWTPVVEAGMRARDAAVWVAQERGARVLMSEHDRSALLSHLDDVTADYERRIAALTAAPEKPRVDVRKVLQKWNIGRSARPQYADLEGALLRAGYEVVE